MQLGTYPNGFAIIIEPFDSRLPNIPDPVIQVSKGIREDIKGMAGDNSKEISGRTTARDAPRMPEGA